MRYFRDKEPRRMLFFTLFTMAVALVLSASYPRYAIIPVAAMGVVFMAFTLGRYEQIASLGDYLRRVNNQEYRVLLPGDEEGELSILKSEIYKVTVSLRAQNERLLAERVRMADALSDICHQLKTPLTSMSVMADLLARGDMEEEKRSEFTHRLRSQVERLSWLTDALLKLSRLDADAVTFEPRSVAIGDLVTRAVSALLVPLELREQTLTVSVQGEVFCDRAWTAEALGNIVKNCMEHAPKGGHITITASHNPLFTEITVGDDGPGIDRADLPRIFERFYKGKNSSSEGVGIGLAMSRAIIDAQGAILEAENGHQGGSLFRIRFPSQPDSRAVQQRAIREEASAESSGERK